MSAWAKPGVKCVCIDGRILPGRILTTPIDLTVPKKGQTYTIRWVGIFTWPDGASGVGVHLEELARVPAPDGKVYPFGLYRFRPLITKSQEDDVALFRSLLDALPVGESA